MNAHFSIIFEGEDKPLEFAVPLPPGPAILPAIKAGNAAAAMALFQAALGPLMTTAGELKPVIN